jgi:hypothetical protein
MPPPCGLQCFLIVFRNSGNCSSRVEQDEITMLVSVTMSHPAFSHAQHDYGTNIALQDVALDYAKL